MHHYYTHDQNGYHLSMYVRPGGDGDNEALTFKDLVKQTVSMKLRLEYNAYDLPDSPIQYRRVEVIRYHIIIAECDG